jgi:hypothetical protein
MFDTFVVPSVHIQRLRNLSRFYHPNNTRWPKEITRYLVMSFIKLVSTRSTELLRRCTDDAIPAQESNFETSYNSLYYSLLRLRNTQLVMSIIGHILWRICQRHSWPVTTTKKQRVLLKIYFFETATHDSILGTQARKPYVCFSALPRMQFMAELNRRKINVPRTATLNAYLKQAGRCEACCVLAPVPCTIWNVIHRLYHGLTL